MNKITLVVLFFLCINITANGQMHWEMAQEAFDAESYLIAISHCKKDSIDYPSVRRIPRANLIGYATLCLKLFSEKECSSFEEIKRLRGEYASTIREPRTNDLASPHTDKKLDACRRRYAQSFGTRIKMIIQESSNQAMTDSLMNTILTNTNTLFDELDRGFSYCDDIRYDELIITPRGIRSLDSLWNKSRIYVFQDIDRVQLYTNLGGYEVKNIHAFSEQGGDVAINIKYSNKGEIDGISEALPELQYNIPPFSARTDSLHINQIKQFVETFRLAYCDKNIEYIEKVFSDDALIIEGRELKVVQVDQNIKRRYLDVIYTFEYDYMNKSQYIHKLSNVMNGNEYIYVEFGGIEIMRHQKNNNFYGVHLIQHWSSTSNANDIGRLFLMIDFSYPDAPLIWVRALQPMNDSNKIWLGSFIIN